MSFKVMQPGLSTSIQDLGRPGYFHLGIPIGGAMDRFALRVANMLVGNPEGAAGLEVVFMGPQIVFDQDALVAVTGADLPAKVDGVLQEGWTAFEVKSGQTLSFDFLKSGARAYIAISGGIDTPAALESRSTYPIGALGGIDGRNIQAGDVIPVGEADMIEPGLSVPENLRRMPGKPAELRVLPGLYWHRLTSAAQEGFFRDDWTVALEADRMGYRFKGGKPL